MSAFEEDAMPNQTKLKWGSLAITVIPILSRFEKSTIKPHKNSALRMRNKGSTLIFFNLLIQAQ
jgi:hypothetical protein